MKRYVNDQERMKLLPLIFTKSLQVQKQVNSRLNFEDVNVDLKLSVFLRPIHAVWLVETYAFLSFYLSQEFVTRPWGPFIFYWVGGAGGIWSIVSVAYDGPPS